MSFFPTTVIVATDGTGASRHALEAAVEIARATGSQLHLLHVKVTSSTLRGRPMTPGQRETTEREGHEVLAREAAAAAELGLEVAGTHLRHAEKLERAITVTAEELGAGPAGHRRGPRGPGRRAAVDLVRDEHGPSLQGLGAGGALRSDQAPDVRSPATGRGEPDRTAAPPCCRAGPGSVPWCGSSAGRSRPDPRALSPLSAGAGLPRSPPHVATTGSHGAARAPRRPTGS
jgi:hypothetical protein